MGRQETQSCQYHNSKYLLSTICTNYYKRIENYGEKEMLKRD